jgi:hypothetical protein
MQVVTLPDITTTGSAVQLAASGMAKWIAFTALTDPARVGDSNVGSARGVEVPAGETVVFPICRSVGDHYSLSQIYVYLSSGGTLSVTYGT